MTNKFTTVDELSRESIINDIDANLFIEAGAGSGKTTMLVNRMVAMIEAGIPVDKICAITFTKNAALEFYERFQRKLIERSNENYEYIDNGRAGQLGKPNNTTINRCKDALAHIDLCFMGTIDSFCNMILSEHPYEAGIENEAKLISDIQRADIYRQIYVDIRNGLYGNTLKKKSSLFEILYYDPQDKFVSFLNEFMDRRNMQIIVEDKNCNNFYDEFEKDRLSLKKVLNAFNVDVSRVCLELSKNDNRDYLEVYKQANEILQKGWSYNVPGVIRALKDISKLTYKGNIDELDIGDELTVRQVEDTICLNINDEESKDSLLPRIREYKYDVTMSFIYDCIDVVQNKMKGDGKFTYFDYLYFLRNMLKEDASRGGKLIQYISNRHSYYLIDEFQDTNPLQSEVFFYLTSTNTNETDWKKCLPRDGSLFIVGDPKQSIYRFRGADVASYINIKKLFTNGVGKVLYLNNNFRSRNVLKTYFNNVFEKLMPDDVDNQSKYADIENCNNNEDYEFDGIYTYESYGGSLIKDYPLMEDSCRVATIIKQLVNNHNYQIKDRNSGELRTVKFSDFMIIFASKRGIGNCIATFKKEDIPLRVEGKVLFEENEALINIFNIYKAVCNRNDVISLVAVLYSPIFGFNDNDLAYYVSKGKEIKLKDVEYEDNELENALNKLNNTANKISSLTPATLFEYIMDEYQIFRYVSSEELEIVYYTLELIRNGEINGEIVTYEDAIKYMETLLSGKSDIERCLSLKENEDAVHIANLHKVKGLEAPIVILTKAGSASINPSVRIEEVDEEKCCYMLSLKVDNPYLDMSVSEVETKRYAKEYEKEVECLKKENDRLIYVAATRARNVLIINSPKILNSKTNKIQNTANRWKVLKENASGDIFEILKENKDYIPKQHKHILASDLYDSFVPLNINKEPSYKLVSPSTIRIVNKYREEYNDFETSDNGEESYATLMGTMVHRMMEIIVITKDSYNRDDLVKIILNEYVTSDFEEYREIFKNKLNKVYDVIHNGGFVQKGKAKQDILALIKDADEISCEVPFGYRQGDTIYNGIIDMLYKKDNKLHIIDYKTNKNDTNLDEHYKGQLEAYIEAVEYITKQKVEDALIYHIDIND